MMKRNHTRLCAGAATAAALALTSTPLAAQMAPEPATVAAEPVLTIPETVPAAAPIVPPAAAPVLPTELSQSTVTDTAPATDEAVAEPAAVAPAASAARTERPAPRDSVAAPRDAAASPRAEVAPAEPTPVAVTDPAPAELESAEAAAPFAATAEPLKAPTAVDDDNTQFWIAALGGLAALGLALWGFIAIGRRKPADRKAAMVLERPVVKPIEPAPQPAAVAAPASVTPLASARPQPAASNLAHTGAAVPLPSKMPETFAERDALLKRMIAAKPDRANPFTTYKARLKRARLILQSLGRDFGDRKAWIDFSQYPANWPEHSRSRYAAA